MLGVFGGIEVNDIYRIKLPFHFAGFDWASLAKVPEVLSQYRFDVHVLSRISGRYPGVAEQIAGLPNLVYDVDDDMTRTMRNMEEVLFAELHGALVSRCRYITTPTPYLGKVYSERYGRPYYVLPNCLDPDMWVVPDREDDTLTVGLAGGDSHYADWRMVYEPLKRLAREYPIRVVVAGYLPDYFEKPWVTHVPWLDYVALPQVIREFDIGLCPLPTNQFNLCKSDIKAVEYMASVRSLGPNLHDGGVAVLASDMPVYRRAVDSGANGLLVRDNDWYGSIKRVIEDEELRVRLQQRGLGWVRRNRDVKKEAQRWVRFYRKVAQGG